MTEQEAIELIATKLMGWYRVAERSARIEMVREVLIKIEERANAVKICAGVLLADICTPVKQYGEL